MELQSYLKSNKAVADYATLAFDAGNNVPGRCNFN